MYGAILVDMTIHSAGLRDKMDGMAIKEKQKSS